MTMRRLREKTVLALAVAFGFCPAAWASLTAEELQSVVSKSQAFDAQTKVTTALNGSELTISTYRPDRATEQDCKIDATLAAKAAFEADSSLSRVVVLFYDVRIPNDFFEIPVTVGDVAAYKSGQITQAQLLSALRMTKHAPAETVPAQVDHEHAQAATKEKEAAAKTQPDATSIEQSLASLTKIAATSAGAPSSSFPAAASKTGTSVFSNYGVTFSYPKSWRVEYPREGNVLARLFMHGSSMLEMRVYSRKEVSPTDVVESDPDQMFTRSWNQSVKSSMMEVMPGWFKAMAARHEQEEASEHRERAEKYERWKEDYRRKFGHDYHGADNDDAENHAANYHFADYRPVQLPASVSIGAGKSIKGLQRGYYATPAMHEHHHGSFGSMFTEYVQSVVFESPPYVVQLSILCPKSDAYDCTAQFNTLLSGVKVAGASGKAGKPGKSHAVGKSH